MQLQFNNTRLGKAQRAQHFTLGGCNVGHAALCPTYGVQSSQDSSDANADFPAQRFHPHRQRLHPGFRQTFQKRRFGLL